MADKVGKHYNFRDQEFWACNGLIYIIDYRDGIPDDNRFKIETRAEFATRAIMLNEMARGWKWHDERHEFNKAVENMVAVVKEAKRQGDPTDPETAKKLAWENRKMIFVMNYNPGSRSKLILPGDARYKFDPGMPPIPQAPAEAAIATSDSAPDLRI